MKGRINILPCITYICSKQFGDQIRLLLIVFVLANSVDPDEMLTGSLMFAKVGIWESLVYKRLKIHQIGKQKTNM